ncbi:unnamed protein product, partial [Polarella glacialis]
KVRGRWLLVSMAAVQVLASVPLAVAASSAPFQRRLRVSELRQQEQEQHQQPQPQPLPEGVPFNGSNVTEFSGAVNGSREDGN